MYILKEQMSNQELRRLSNRFNHAKKHILKSDPFKPFNSYSAILDEICCFSIKDPGSITYEIFYIFSTISHFHHKVVIHATLRLKVTLGPPALSFDRCTTPAKLPT